MRGLKVKEVFCVFDDMGKLMEICETSADASYLCRGMVGYYIEVWRLYNKED